MNHFPSNKITSFKNHLGEPIRLDDGFEVALVECSYVHSSVIIHSGEVIGNTIDPEFTITAPRDLYSCIELVGVLEEWKVENNFHSHAINYISDEFDISQIQSAFKLTRDQVKSRVTLPSNDRVANFDIQNDEFNKTARVVKVNNFNFKPRIKYMLGWSEHEQKYRHNIFDSALRTQLYVYCDVIQNQRVGGDSVPLLRKMSYVGKHDEITTRTFQHLQYINVAYSDFDTIWIYIRDEIGEPLPVSTGSFSCTLHFRRKRY
jgi:hypothetical protein